MRTVRIFVSSPSDAQFERMRVDRVAERLNGEFAGVARLKTIRWEREFYRAHATFQDQIPEAKDCDIVVAILRHRLGTELPDDFPTMSNGDRYPSGTAYEVLTAIEKRKERDLPDVYVFRYPEPPTVRLDDTDTSALITEQWEKLKGFFKTWFQTPEGHFTAAFHEFRSTDEFEGQIESLLRKWLEEKILKGRSVVWPIETKGSPFRGLAAFGVKHAPVFFGRARDTAKATDAFKDAAERGVPFLLIVGASGAGKSSLVRAGVVPRLTTPGVVPGVDVWRVAVMRPSEHPDGPLAALAARLFDGESEIGEDDKGLPAALPEIRGSDYSTPAELEDLLAHADETATKPILRALDKAEEEEQEGGGFERPVRASLLLVVDQLDELFADAVDDTQLKAFVRVLSVLAATGRVWIVATLRADLYEIFLKEPVLLDLKTRGASFDVAPPSATELDEIVRAPAAAAGLVYEIDPETREALDERLLRAADAPDMLPLLQFTLDQLFEQRETVGGEVRLTIAAYERLGGLAGAIDKQAERAIADLEPGEIDALPKLLRLLVVQRQPDGSSGGYTIRSVRLADVAVDEPLRRLVDALSRARILIVSDEGAGATVRLVHQRILESWTRARQAVRTNADFYRILDDVRSQHRRWLASGTHPSTLLQRGRPLAEARLLASEYPDATSADVLNFISASLCKSRYRTIAWVTMLLAPALVLVMLILDPFIGSILDSRATAGLAVLLFIGAVTLLYPVSLIVNLGTYVNRIRIARTLTDENAESFPPIARTLMSRHILMLRAVKYGVSAVLILASIAFFIPPLAKGFLSDFLNVSQEEVLQHNAVVSVNAFYFTCLILAIPFINAVPVLAFRYEVRVSRQQRNRLADLDGPMKRLAPHPLPILALLAVVSGSLSALLVPRVDDVPPVVALFDPLYYGPPLLFGCVLGIGELLWAGRQLRTVALIVGATVVAWFLAYATGYSIAVAWRSDSMATLGAGFVAGGIGAALTALALPTLRQMKRWEISAVIGAVAGVSLWLSVGAELHSIYMFVVWQGSFAAYFGFCLQRSVALGSDLRAPVAA